MDNIAEKVKLETRNSKFETKFASRLLNSSSAFRPPGSSSFEFRISNLNIGSGDLECDYGPG